MKFYVEPVSSHPYLLYANEGLDYSVMMPDSLMMSLQTRYSGPAVRLEMVSSHHPTGSVPEVDLPLPGRTTQDALWIVTFLLDPCSRMFIKFVLIRFNTLIQLTHHYILYCESALCQFFH